MIKFIHYRKNRDKNFLNLKKENISNELKHRLKDNKLKKNLMNFNEKILMKNKEI
jgi:hypothetical protein